MIWVMFRKCKKLSNEEKLFDLLKKAVVKFIKTETTGSGVINLVFGLILAILVFAMCIPSIFIQIIKIFFSNLNMDMPWWSNLVFFVLLGMYFLVCFIRLDAINKAKK